MGEHTLSSRDQRRRGAEDSGRCQFTLGQADHRSIGGRGTHESVPRDNGDCAGESPVHIVHVGPAENSRPEISDFVIDVPDVDVRDLIRRGIDFARAEREPADGAASRSE